MKRVATLAFAAMLVMGLTAMAGYWDGDVTEDDIVGRVDAEFTIGSWVVLTVDSTELVFVEDLDDVQDPNYRGDARTEILGWNLTTNHYPAVGVSLSGSPFTHVDLETVTLETTAMGGHWKDGEMGISIFSYELPEGGSLGQFEPGDYSGTLRLRVTRSGLSDPSGTYRAHVELTVTADL